MPTAATLLPEAPWLFDSDQVLSRLSRTEPVWAAGISLAQMCVLLANSAVSPSDAHAALAMAEALRLQLPPANVERSRDPQLLEDLPRFDRVSPGPLLSTSLLLCSRLLITAAMASRPDESALAHAVSSTAHVLRALAVTTTYMSSLASTLRDR